MTTLIHSPPAYDPPYESPLEDRFAWDIVKYLDSSVSWKKQVEVETICGTFRLDFQASLPNHTVAIECDGKDFHDAYRDEWRDAMILGDRQADVVYRLRGADIHYHNHDCLYVMSRCDPAIFSSRGHKLLDRLASKEAKITMAEYGFQELMRETNLHVTYRESRACGGIRIERHRQADAFRQFWQVYHAVALQHGGGDLDRLIELDRQTRRSSGMGAPSLPGVGDGWRGR